MKIVVTGSRGFVGARVVAECVRRGWSVRGVVRSSDSLPDSTQVHWLPAGDLMHRQDFRSLLAGADAVVHLAARVHVMGDAHQGGRDDLYVPANVDLTRRLAEDAVREGVKRFVFMSSVKAAGESSGDHPLSEADPPAPVDAYGRSKLAAERALAEIASRSGLDVVSLRPPLVYGPGVRANFLRLMRLVDRRIPLPFACLDNRRSLVCVDNLADAVATALAAPSPVGGVYFVRDDEDLSTPQLISRLAQALETRACLFPLPPKLLRWGLAMLGKGEEGRRLVGSLQISSAAFAAATGWQPPVSVDAGLAATAAAYRSEAARRNCPI